MVSLELDRWDFSIPRLAKFTDCRSLDFGDASAQPDDNASSLSSMSLFFFFKALLRRALTLVFVPLQFTPS